MWSGDVTQVVGRRQIQFVMLATSPSGRGTRPKWSGDGTLAVERRDPCCRAPVSKPVPFFCSPRRVSHRRDRAQACDLDPGRDDDKSGKKQTLFDDESR